MIREAVQELQTASAASETGSSLTFVSRLSTGLPIVEGCPHDLRRLLTFLLRNAVAALGEGEGVISVEAEALDGKVLLRCATRDRRCLSRPCRRCSSPTRRPGKEPSLWSWPPASRSPAATWANCAGRTVRAAVWPSRWSCPPRPLPRRTGFSNRPRRFQEAERWRGS